MFVMLDFVFGAEHDYAALGVDPPWLLMAIGSRDASFFVKSVVMRIMLLSS
jgi:hypothetical protein